MATMSFIASCFAVCLPCLSSTPLLRINKSNFKILRLLGEGAYSYVYLVQAGDGGLYALKKIRCPFGNENVKTAMKEVDSYREFRSPYIIQAIDSSVVQEPDGSKTVYILLPYFQDGSLQDVITKNVVNGQVISEEEALSLFVGICRGVQSMHRHHPKTGYTMERSGSTGDQDDLASATESQILLRSEPLEDDEDEVDPFADGGSQYGDSTELTETVSFAHRDIKPANIMVSQDGNPVLCDLGSCARAHVTIKNRAQAITVQELAEEHCTLPYRAPELLDVKVGDELDERIDIWSLGCTLYALLYGYSPFEREELENGANINLAISSGIYSFPANPAYSDGIKDLIRACLELDPHERPSIETILSKAMKLNHRITG
ncbi:unnamed protein product [Kuraishia capsulata CBS 1993]|uniref:non-specific serine/threonine protein kinase n=1 Tax=Kuraishia capsulata CBS 1993 TaxID=1382522 RepID=W6MPI8_9ASCO|nr:uncharacterized protein KUCA_T00002999001 [Kuraishia capsulata CBS 1993]CDK27022.1 unnamed protein product [Kuraishia capsulata CBS 1993]